MAALRSRCTHYIFVLWFLLLSSSFSSPNFSRRRLDVCHTSTHGVALVRIYDAGLKRAARLVENTGRKKSPKIRHVRTIAEVCRALSSQVRHISTIGKKLLNSNISSTCSDNTVNFGPLSAAICWRVWDTSANFNGFRVLAALLHGTLVVGVSQILRRWTEGATYIGQGAITLGIGPHSSLQSAAVFIKRHIVCERRRISATPRRNCCCQRRLDMGVCVRNSVTWSLRHIPFARFHYEQT